MLGKLAFVAMVIVAAHCVEYYYYDPTICENIGPGLWVRDSVDCSVAHQCGLDMEVTQSVQCNASQVWSKKASACVWEWDQERDDCNMNLKMSVKADERCLKKTGNNPHPDDCSRFLSCANGTMVAEVRCADGTLYWPKNETCEFAGAVAHECGHRKIPMSVTVNQDDPLCLDNGQVADPVSCRHFIQCLHGRKVQRIQCPRGTAFSDHTGKCEWYEEVHCGSRAR